jgi:alpha-1,4-digalacturonate transport system permease protein
MKVITEFLFRTKGGNRRLTLADYFSYAYLFFGFLIIFVPVLWIVLNSVKTQFQLEKQDLSLLPSDYIRIGRATVYGPEGRDIFFIPDLPEWVLGDRKIRHSISNEKVIDFLSQYQGREYYALRSYLGQVSPQSRKLIKEKNLPEWMILYPSIDRFAKVKFDVQGAISGLDDEQKRLLLEYLGVKPYAPNRFNLQILVTAPDPKNGEIREYAVSSLTSTRPTISARAVADPAGQVTQLPKESVSAKSVMRPAWSNYIDPLSQSSDGVSINFPRCFANSFIVTIVATMITLLINSMAAFALSKYKFRGQMFFFVVILATLMVPASITLVGLFKVIAATGLSGSLWGVIIPGAATPAGVFMLRQYMLTIPDELIEAARMDAASEWKVYWRIILPLAMPALAALGILSIVWRWNDLILPLVAISTNKDAYTIQLALLAFRGENVSQEHYRLAMTVVSLIPTTLIFAFLQRYITTGIASSGVK